MSFRKSSFTILQNLIDVEDKLDNFYINFNKRVTLREILRNYESRKDKFKLF